MKKSLESMSQYANQAFIRQEKRRVDFFTNEIKKRKLQHKEEIVRLKKGLAEAKANLKSVK